MKNVHKIFVLRRNKKMFLLISISKGDYVWRCIKLSILEQFYDSQFNGNSPRMEVARSENRAITVDPDINCLFTSLYQEKEIECVCSNNCDRVFRGRVEMLGRKGKSQVQLMEPEQGATFELEPHAKRAIRFKVESQYLGQSNEQFLLQFENFRIKRSITIIVCETEAEAEAIKQNLSIEEKLQNNENTPPVMGGRNQTYRSRHYANQV